MVCCWLLAAAGHLDARELLLSLESLAWNNVLGNISEEAIPRTGKSKNKKKKKKEEEERRKKEEKRREE